MPRTKGGVVTRRRHKKIIKMAKGHKGNRHKTFKQANESVMHALRYAWEHRRDKKGDFRRLWQIKINAAIRPLGLSYSQFIHALKTHKIELDRKILADLAEHEPATFARIVESLKK